ncbi:MAG: phosphatase [Desulfovibrionales bacterium]|jgi:hypothetical protein|nr:phosphatase [Desulfovibrionales bacterium]
MSPVYQPTWVTEQLAIGAAPMSHAQLDALREMGIAAILNLCGEFCDLHEIECAAGFEVYHIPLADEEAPQLVELEKALEWLDEAIYLGKKVLIHCRHGIGRTGTVLNAYLLRRGLGHRLAWFKMRPLRAKPANFAQWRTVRKYGKESPKLTIREPSLEMRRAVDLSPFFHDYEALVHRVEQEKKHDPMQQCGQNHTQCCYTSIYVTLVESLYVTNKMNLCLQSSERLQVINRAVESSKNERKILQQMNNADLCLSQTTLLCPVSMENKCLLFEYRPIQCRTFDLTQEQAYTLWDELIQPSLDRLSSELWMAFTGELIKEELPHFSFADVLSGKYIQTLFHVMSKN